MLFILIACKNSLNHSHALDPSLNVYSFFIRLNMNPFCSTSQRHHIAWEQCHYLADKGERLLCRRLIFAQRAHNLSFIDG